MFLPIAYPATPTFAADVRDRTWTVFYTFQVDVGSIMCHTLRPDYPANALLNFVILVRVCVRTAYDNRTMQTDKETDLLPWVLAAIVVVIMGAAVALYPNESAASSSSVQGQETPSAAADQHAAIQNPQPPSPAAS